MKVITTIKHLSSFPPKVIVAKIWNRLNQQRRHKRLENLYYKSDVRSDESASITNLLPLIPLSKAVKTIDVKNPKFDLLGSGPIRNTYSEEASGLENFHYPNQFPTKTIDSNGDFLSHVVLPKHLSFSKTCWKIIQEIDSNYEPIDWQRDFKSGFRYDAKQWFLNQRKIMPASQGVDLKVPWELSRLQHLPSLALSIANHSKEDQSIQNYILCQLLDFVMANPVGMGVNFNCPMDIGIRNANILITLDWLKKQNALPQNIESILCNYVSTSTTHILEDIEYREGLTSNHYLGNVLGILFAGAYLESNTEANRWLAFGIQELERSMERQFFNDGSNFEGSTNYHRLSGEMMVWGAGLIACLPKHRIDGLKNYSNKNWNFVAPLFSSSLQKFNSENHTLTAEFWQKLIYSYHFAESVARPNGNAVQFGDNDSGRFVKLTPFGTYISSEKALQKYSNLSPTLFQSNEEYWDENDLNHGGFISSVAGLLDKQPKLNVHFADAEFQIFNKIIKQNSSLKKLLNTFQPQPVKSYSSSNSNQELAYHKQKTFDFADIDLTTNLKFEYYPDFQIAFLKSDNLYVSLAGISNPNQHHSFGHTHSDKLGIVLTVNNQDIIVNPGTYLYTPIPERRLEFRTVVAHNTVSVNQQEQNTPLAGKLGLFNVKTETKFQLLELSKTTILAEITYRDVIHRRKVEITAHQVIIDDWCNQEFTQHWNTGNPLSNGYGKRIKN